MHSIVLPLKPSFLWRHYDRMPNRPLGEHFAIALDKHHLSNMDVLGQAVSHQHFRYRT